jgi:hypothetical protein
MWSKVAHLSSYRAGYNFACMIELEFTHDQHMTSNWLGCVCIMLSSALTLPKSLFGNSSFIFQEMRS